MENDEKAKTQKKRLNKKLLILFIMIPILIALGVVIGGYISDGVIQAEEEPAEEEVLPEKTITLDEFLLNLEPSGNLNRYIRLELALSTVKEGGIEEIEENINKIRDVIIYKVTRESVENIFADDDKSFLMKTELKEDINEALGDDVIYSVYISNIVIQ